MTQRYQLIKDEIMHTMMRTPAASYSITGLHERLAHKMTRTEIDRAVACLLSRQHIKRTARHTYSVGDDGSTKPYDLSGYKHGVLPDIQQPPQSNRQKIAEAEEKRRQQSAGKKTMQDWHNGSKPAVKSPAPPATVPAEPVIASTAKQSSPDSQKQTPSQKDIDYAIEQLQNRLIEPTGKTIQDLPLKLSVLEKLSQIVDPTIGSVLEQIKTDLQGEAA
jgi:hypothetical protein